MPTFTILEFKNPKTHYGFIVETVKSKTFWTLAKEIQDDPQVKRLAFKIDSKEKGESEVFDKGRYIAEVEIAKGVRKQIKDSGEGEQLVLEGIKKGEIKFTLLGKKVIGSYALIKTKNFPPGKTNAWLLIKHKD